MDELPRDRFDDWLAALQTRHLADLRVAEVTRALRALSSAYVQRRQTLAHGAALAGAGKRAAFALYYAPLHFLTTRLIVRQLNMRAPHTIFDVGCGTGAAGAAWAVEAGGQPRVIGVDNQPWAVAEAQWTYSQLGIDGRARRADVARLRLPRGELGIVAAYLLNELKPDARNSLWHILLTATARGPVLILEPIARTLTPWWDTAAREALAAGGRADEWRFAVELPPIVELLDRSAGLNHRELTARSLFIPQS